MPCGLFAYKALAIFFHRIFSTLGLPRIFYIFVVIFFFSQRWERWKRFFLHILPIIEKMFVLQFRRAEINQ